MTPRVARLKERLRVDRYPICTEKARLIVDSYRQTEGEPQIVRRAKATAHYLDRKTISIEDDELIVGNVACRPMGLEAGSMGPAWPGMSACQRPTSSGCSICAAVGQAGRAGFEGFTAQALIKQALAAIKNI